MLGLIGSSVAEVFSREAVVADEDTASVVLGVLLAMAGWAALYAALCYCNSSRSCEWNCRLVSTLHALVVITMTSWSGFLQGPWPLTHPGGPNTRLQHWTCVVCGGYFIYDLAWCLFFQTESVVMLFHHVISIYGQLLVLLRGRNGTEMMATLWGSELTNPLLQARWFLRETERHTTWCYELNDAVFMLLFGCVRVGLGGLLLYCELVHPAPDWIAKAGGAAMYILSWVFWLLIVNYAVRKYSKMWKSRIETQKQSFDQNSEAMKNNHKVNGHHIAEDDHVKSD